MDASSGSSGPAVCCDRCSLWRRHLVSEGGYSSTIGQVRSHADYRAALNGPSALAAMALVICAWLSPLRLLSGAFGWPGFASRPDHAGTYCKNNSFGRALLLSGSPSRRVRRYRAMWGQRIYAATSGGYSVCDGSSAALSEKLHPDRPCIYLAGLAVLLNLSTDH